MTRKLAIPPTPAPVARVLGKGGISAVNGKPIAEVLADAEENSAKGGQPMEQPEGRRKRKL